MTDAQVAARALDLMRADAFPFTEPVDQLAEVLHEGLRLGDRPGRIDVEFLDARCGEWGSLEALLQACSNAMSVRASWTDSNTDSRAVDALRRVADAIALSRGESQEPTA